MNNLIDTIALLFDPELFTIEDAEVQDLNGGIKKKFTTTFRGPVTYTHIYDPTLFKWNFGDDSPIEETDQRVIYHTYKKPGLYLINHSACNFCTCSNWYNKCIKICKADKKEEECDKDIEKEGYQGCEIETVTNPLSANTDFVVGDFVVGDTDINSLNGGITKKFTSLATNATKFYWQFGDTQQNPIIETTENPYYHSYKEKGTYRVSHQSCSPCRLILTCSGWCTKDVIVEAPKPNILPLVATAGLFFLIFPKKECEDYDNIKDCEKHACQWLKKEKKCVKKCVEGFKAERVKNRHDKYACKPIKKNVT